MKVKASINQNTLYWMAGRCCVVSFFLDKYCILGKVKISGKFHLEDIFWFWWKLEDHTKCGFLGQSTINSKAIILGRKSFRLLASKTKGREQNWSLVSFTAAYIYSSTKLIALNVSIITFLVYLYNFKMDIISTMLSYIIGFIREYDLGWIFCNQCNTHIENILFSCCNYKSMEG